MGFKFMPLREHFNFLGRVHIVEVGFRFELNPNLLADVRFHFLIVKVPTHYYPGVRTDIHTDA